MDGNPTWKKYGLVAVEEAVTLDAMDVTKDTMDVADMTTAVSSQSSATSLCIAPASASRPTTANGPPLVHLSSKSFIGGIGGSSHH